jgi:hypothetical protein
MLGETIKLGLNSVNLRRQAEKSRNREKRRERDAREGERDERERERGTREKEREGRERKRERVSEFCESQCFFHPHSFLMGVIFYS